MQTIYCICKEKHRVNNNKTSPKNIERNKWLIFHIAYILNNKKCFEIQIFSF